MIIKNKISYFFTPMRTSLFDDAFFISSVYSLWGHGFLFNLLFKKCLKSELTKRFKSFLKDAARYLNVHFRYIMKPPE